VLIIGGSIGATMTSFPKRIFFRGFFGGVKISELNPQAS
jgi:hypothetical protein